MTILHFLQCGHFLTDSLKVGGAKGRNHTHHILVTSTHLLHQQQTEMVQRISPKLAPVCVPGGKKGRGKGGGRGEGGGGGGGGEREGRLCQYLSFSIDKDLLIFVNSLVKNSYI